MSRAEWKRTSRWPAPWLYLQSGDVVVAEGSGLGRLVNRVGG